MKKNKSNFDILLGKNHYIKQYEKDNEVLRNHHYHLLFY